MEFLGPLWEVLLVGRDLLLLLGLTVLGVRQLLLIAVSVTGLDSGGRLSYRALHVRGQLLVHSVVGLLVNV